MTTEDKLYNKIKKATENAAEKDFPSFEKVWNRVDEKLDTVTVKKSNHLWKAGTIAASFLLFASIGYHFYNQNQETLIVPNEKTIEKSISNEVVLEEKSTLLEKEEMDVIIESNTTTPTVVSVDLPKKEISYPEQIELVNDDVVITYKKDSVKPINSAKSKVPTFAISESAVNTYNSASSNDLVLAKSSKDYTAPTKKLQQNQGNDPLIVIDDEVSDVETLKEISPEIIDSVYVLPNPLYIINGVEYSEESLFGKKPTSPYAPLAKQKITKNTILKPDEAIKIYGKKGENGVVIIETKNGKPTIK